MTDLIEALRVVGEYARGEGATAVDSWCEERWQAVAARRMVAIKLGREIVAAIDNHNQYTDAELGEFGEIALQRALQVLTGQSPSGSPENPSASDPGPETTDPAPLRSRNITSEPS